ncbi:MAG: PDZ domain-containing protein [Vicinamibacterales bacterium]
MTKARFTVFAGGLTLGVALSVAGLLAQDRSPAQPDRQFHVLDGRGSEIGVTIRDLEAGDGQAGVVLETVNPGGPAAKAGARDGDIVVEFDGERVRSARQFSRLVQETPDGRAVPLVVRRDGARRQLTVTPEARTAAAWFDDGRLSREIERGLRDLEPRLRELEPRLREFRFDGPPMRFDLRDLGASRGRLGVQVEPLTPQLADYFAAAGGVLVASVTADSPAARAGIRAGDVITGINGATVADTRDLLDGLDDAPSAEVTLAIVRERQATTVTVTVEDRAPQGRGAARGARPGAGLRF